MKRFCLIVLLLAGCAAPSAPGTAQSRSIESKVALHTIAVGVRAAIQN